MNSRSLLCAIVLLAMGVLPLAHAAAVPDAAVGDEQPAALTAFDKQRLCAHGPAGPDRTVHSAGDQFLGPFKQRRGSVSLHRQPSFLPVGKRIRLRFSVRL